MKTFLMPRALQDKSGATAIEYALIAAMIALIIVGSIGAVGSVLTDLFQQIVDGFPTS